MDNFYDENIKNLFGLLQSYKMSFLVHSSIYKSGDPLKTTKPGIRNFMILELKGIK